jgi:hypothetical protein
MEATPKKYITLREIGRNLSIPASTIVYYRDRFSKYIPFKQNPNGRCKYPTECLEIFKTIRRCFNQKWSWEQIEDELAAHYAVVPGKYGEPFEYGLNTPWTIADNQGLLKEMTASMAKIANALDRQRALSDQLHQFRDELSSLRDEKRQADEKHREQMIRLENELDRIKKAHSQETFRQPRSEHARQGAPSPGSDFLTNPLTVHFPPQRYIGIRDSQNAALNLNQLIETIRDNSSGSKTVAFAWNQTGGSWTLTAGLKGPNAQKDRRITLQAKATVTPQANSVTEVIRMTIEDRELSKDDLLKFFKLYQSGINREGQP